MDEAHRKNVEQPKLSEGHLQQVMKMSKNFKMYMEKTRKMDDAKRAHMLGTRYDTDPKKTS